MTDFEYLDVKRVKNSDGQEVVVVQGNVPLEIAYQLKRIASELSNIDVGLENMRGQMK